MALAMSRSVPITDHEFGEQMVARRKQRRLQIEIPSGLERKLILWAYVRDSQLTPWARTVLSLRAADNEPKVREEIERRAKDLGMSPEDLERAILTQYGFDFEREQEELSIPLEDET